MTKIEKKLLHAEWDDSTQLDEQEAAIVALLETLTDDSRLKIFHKFCGYCGSDVGPRCGCARDE